ncbi:hypothetical protein LguiB_012171 [Lonicera macranthoides]
MTPKRFEPADADAVLASKWNRRSPSVLDLRSALPDQCLHLRSQALWLCLGNFNEVLSLDELVGLNPHPNWQLRNFRNLVDECGFTDLGWTGHKYKWGNNHSNMESYGEARLDRALATKEWLDLYPLAVVVHVVQQGSDHCPIKLCFKGVSNSQSSRRPSAKKFEEW